MSRQVRAEDQVGVAVSKKQDKSGSVFEFVKVVIQAVLIALVVRTFLFQPFNIPSGSLIPTLLVGDYLFVSKYAYGYSKYSFPFSPNLFSGRIWGALPKRGDIAVFKWPGFRTDTPDSKNTIDYIKRVIGLPGDHVRVDREKLYINDEEAKLEFVRQYTDDQKGRHAYVYNETLPNGVKHQIQTLDHRVGEPGGVDTDYVVKENEVFMMGDNRDDSSDSRAWGGAPLENLEGRAELVFFSIKTKPGPQTEPEPETEPIWQFWRWPWTVRWDRLFTRVH